MVSSKINKEVNYIEKRELDMEDIGHESSMYIIDIHEAPALVVLGKPKYTYSSKSIIYYPIYVVGDEKIKAQIGVFETNLNNTISLLDEDGDIDLNKLGEPLLFSFVTSKFIKKTNTSPTKYVEHAAQLDAMITQKEAITNVPLKGKEKEEESDTDDENDVFKLKIPKTQVSAAKEKVDKQLEEGVFMVDPSFHLPKTLPEETDKDADEIRSNFKESSGNKWIEVFMKNNNYDIIEVRGDGDCYFTCIKEAFESIGKKTTVPKLRALLASKVDDEIFNEYRKVFLEFEARVVDIEREIKKLKEKNKEFLKRMREATTKEVRTQILEETKKLKEDHEGLVKEYKEVKGMQDDYVGNMKQIDTIDKFREYIQTSNYWADSWAISTLEVALNYKTIIMSEEAYKAGALDNVLNCGEINKDVDKSRKFDPSFYIMTSYSGNHYNLITYKKKQILSYDEVPYDVRILVVNKCLEKSSGVFYLIPSFRNFKTKLGLDADIGNPKDMEVDDDDLHHELYDPATTFVFHIKSLNTAKPGKGSGETIDTNRVSEFAPLTKIPEWRRKLDDSWSEAPFTLDNHRWASVEHYVQASRFKKGFPDFYSLFSLDNPSELSRDPEIAMQVADLKKAKYNKLRPSGVVVDIDFNMGREEKERASALHAKFIQNQDLRQLLLATKNAMLKQFSRRKASDKDMPLMKLRRDIQLGNI